MAENITENNSAVRNLSSLLDQDTYYQFLEEVIDRRTSDSIVSFTLPIDHIDPLACLELLADKTSYQYYWEKPEDEFALSAGGSLLSITASGEDRFRKISERIADVKKMSFEFSASSHSQSGIHFIGGFSFFDSNNAAEWESFESANFVIPEWHIIKEGQLTLLTLNFKASSFKAVGELDEHFRQTLGDAKAILELNSQKQLLVSNKKAKMPPAGSSSQAYRQWVASVSKAKQLISQDKFDKIVLARETEIELDKEVEPTHIINTLREQYPNCYTFLIRQENSKTFLGCTPERLASFKKNYMLTEALAGSIKRGSTATEDAILEKELMQSAKNADEHRFVIKAIEQRLSAFAKKIDRGTKPIIKKLTNVQHLFTPITAWLKEGTNPLSILEQLHPTPAVGGYPWKDAAPHIQELENFERGWYAGPVGWLDGNGGGEFAVAIRSGLISDNKARFYAGCGIISDSDAETEWRETNLKFTPMLSALQYD